MHDPDSRRVEDHPTSETLPTPIRGNRWQLCEPLGVWELVMTPEHPEWEHVHPPHEAADRERAARERR